MEAQTSEDAHEAEPVQNAPVVYMRRAIGTRQQVWEGSAHHTAGGLTKDDLTISKNKFTPGKIVSKRRQKVTYTTIEKAGHRAFNELVTHTAPSGMIPIHSGTAVRYKRILAPGSLTEDFEELKIVENNDLSTKKFIP